MHRLAGPFCTTDFRFDFNRFQLANLHFSVYMVSVIKILEMPKMGCGKRAGLVAVSLLFNLLAAIAQPGGFLSIDCGGKSNRTENNITWVTDANFIDVGQTADAHNATLPSYLQNLRFFPNPLNKCCYQLPVEPNMPYLLRLWFAVGNYSGYSQSIRYSIETLGLLTVRNETIDNTDSVLQDESIVVSSGSVLFICLIRTSETNDPFISAIELRTLRDGMYRRAQPGTMLSLGLRWDAGGESLVRYPQDEFDRFWASDSEVDSSFRDRTKVVNSKENISAKNTPDLPPSIVMQTALVSGANVKSLELTLENAESLESLLLLYFAEIEPVNRTQTTSFDVYINGQIRSNATIMLRNYSALEVAIPLPEETQYSLELNPTSKSTLSPIINALEYYFIFGTDPETYSQDNPCYVIEWDGISCDKSGSSIRISEMNLSGRNLTGSVPQNFAQLTALVNLSLENNHLTGQLPNLSSLTMLERLHLQNNNLTGSIPDWLSGLKNLKELFIDNNSFSGVIPAQLLSRPSLNLKYSGNGYLHIPSNSNQDKLRLILAITLSGSLVIVSLLTVRIVVDRKKSRRKETSKLEKESKHVADQGHTAELSPLNWETRLKIASDAAQGLEYLHVGCTPKIIHRDIKTANILLDRKFNGKLADFGLSRVTIDGEASHVFTTVKGTLGYLDPEYFSTQMLTDKSDVYSFGVVLLEIICGRRPINAKLPGEQLNLIRWVTPYVEMDENPGKMEEIIDKRLGRYYDIKSITGVAKLAIRCVQAEPSSRPSVNEVVAELKEAIKLEKHKDSLISEIDIEYGELGASPDSLSVDSSGPKEMDSAESSSKLLTTPIRRMISSRD